MAATPISIMIVEDHAITRSGLRLMLQLNDDFNIVGEAADGATAVSQALTLRPDVILMDIGLPLLDGIEATGLIKSELPNCRVIMFTSLCGGDDMLSALGVGADGYCFKDVSIDELAAGIKVVHAGASWLEDKVKQRMARFRGPDRRSDSVKTDAYPVTQAETDRLEQTSRILNRQAAVTTELAIGSTFADRYLVESVVGQGGMGVVYKAMHVHMARPVAIKVLRSELVTDRHSLRSFWDESRSASNLNHPNVVTMFDFGISPNGQPFLVMDYVDGIGLDSILKQHGSLSQERFLKIFAQVADGLAAAHRRNIVHCDLKPSNIMVVKNNVKHELVKIVDFGLAITVPEESEMQLTDRYIVSGSPRYMSPEQCCGGKLDFRSDVYSLGCVMYEAISGKKIFDAPGPVEMFSKQITELPKSFAQVCPEKSIPIAIENLVLRALAKHPDDRFQSMVELRDGINNSCCLTC